MLKRMSTQFREESYEHVLMCLICRSLFDDNEHQPKFLPCHHTFCKDCLREYIKQTGDEIECPSCRKIATIPAAGVAALQTNFYVKYIQGLVQGSYGGDGSTNECTKHPTCALTYYCKECQLSICNSCCETNSSDTKGNISCAGHEKISLTSITEECHQKLDKSFTKANALIESKKVESEAILKALCQEKDQSLLKIESTFEQHVHALSRRATLLKNKVIDIYNEHVSKIESDLEEIATAMTCTVSLKEYHEAKISQALFDEMEKGISELEEVFDNISTKIQPLENHIIFEDKHGSDKFKIAVKDLGRVRSHRPTIPRTEPEGGRDDRYGSISSQADTPNQPSDPEASPLHGTTEGACGTSIACSKVFNQDTCDKLMSSFHEAVGQCDITQNDSFHHKDSCLFTKTSGTDSTSNISTDSNANNNANTEGDPNSNQLSSQDSFLAVRPKTLDTTKKKTKNISNIQSKSLKAKHLYSGKPVYSGQNVASNNQNELNKPNHLPGNLHNSIELGAIPDIEALKQTDKMYHHLVYTSYDEEELLKELKGHKVALTDPNLSFMARMSESDSWMTASSVDDMILSTGDDHVQQSSL